MKLTIMRIIGGLLIVAAVGLYVYGVVNGDTLTENLPRCIVVALSGVGAIRRTFPKRRSLSVFAKTYAKELRDAFSDDAKKREKLLDALRLYNEDLFSKALAELEKLRADAVTRDEIYAVGLFTALCQEGLGLHAEAIATYEATADQGAGSSQLYSNLGILYASEGEPKKAATSYRKAIELDPSNPMPHNNLAHLLLQMGAYDEAAQEAGAALDLNPSQYQAWTAMAIVEAIRGDAERKEEYIRKAVECGQDEAALRRAIVKYVNAATWEAWNAKKKAE